jgi:two-component system, OmpR family, KDP operon response regulator KdpE
VSSQPVSVLVVDDDSGVRQVLRTSLNAAGYAVGEARSGDEAIGAVRQRQFDLVLLDITMPGITGVEACRRIRSLAPRTGILMITVLSEEDDKVRALEAGADDYITKPFRHRELGARLRAVLRRTRGADMGADGLIRAGKLEMDLGHRTMRRAGQEIHLTPTEFELLAFLMQHQDMPLTHAKLLRTIWGVEYGNELEYLRTYVKMLRKKIEDNPAEPEYLVTEPWVGYRFRDPTDAGSTQAHQEQY